MIFGENVWFEFSNWHFSRTFEAFVFNALLERYLTLARLQENGTLVIYIIYIMYIYVSDVCARVTVLTENLAWGLSAAYKLS